MRNQRNDHLKITGEVMIEIHDAKTGRLKSREIIKNLVVSAGKSSIAAALAGNQTNNGQITYCAVGTSNTAPNVSDAALGAELYRKQVSVRDSAANVARFQTFFNQSEANGNLKECGLFGDLATNVVGSGTIYCHTLIDRDKTDSDTLTLTWSVTVQ